MNNRVLPIGSVIKLKDGVQRVMIMGYLVKNEESGKLYEYSGCLFPIGLDTNNVMLFNTKDIDVVYFIGFQDKQGLFFNGIVEETFEKYKENGNLNLAISDIAQEYLLRKEGEENE